VRSYFPDTLRLRSYPPYASINSGAYTAAGARLPEVDRVMRFKLTARSVAQGWGTFHFIDSVVRVNVISGGSDFRVTAPSGTETWEPNTSKTIEWVVGNTTAEPIECNWVNIYLSLDDGKSYPYLLVANAPNTGSYTITVPDLYTTTARITVKGSGNIFFDVSKATLTIYGKPDGIHDLELANDIVVFPYSATHSVQVKSSKALSVRMFNILGQEVWSGQMNQSITIPTAAFARGQYMLRLIDESNGASTTQKLILE